MYSLVPTNCKFSLKKTAIILQIGLFIKIKDKYLSIIFIIKLEWNNKHINIWQKHVKTHSIYKNQKKKHKKLKVRQRFTLANNSPYL